MPIWMRLRLTLLIGLATVNFVGAILGLIYIFIAQSGTVQLIAFASFLLLFGFLMLTFRLLKSWESSHQQIGAAERLNEDDLQRRRLEARRNQPIDN